MGKRKLLALFGGICLVSILVVSLTGWVPALGLAKEEPSSETLLPPSITPVVVLQGSDYEMGYQYGQQVGEYIEIMRDAAWASALKRYSYDEVLHEIKACQWYIKEYTPEAIEQMKGIADGATAAGYDVSYIDVLLKNCGVSSPDPTWTYPPGAEEEELPPEGGCSIWAAWGSTTTDGRLICGDSADATTVHQVVIVAFPNDGNNYITVVEAGELSEIPAMNNKGVFIGSSGGFAQRDIDYDYGITGRCGLQHLMRFADSAEEAKDMFLPWQISGSSNRLFADVTGDAYVVEATAAIKTVREPGDFGETDFIYCSNNYFTDEMGKKPGPGAGDVFTEHAGWFEYGWAISPIPRNLEMWNMLHNYQGEVDLEFAKMMWRHPGDSPPYPLDSAAYYDPATSGEGWNMQICNLDNEWVTIGLPDDGNRGKMYICTGPAGRVAYPLGPMLSHHHYQIAGTHTFYQLVLSSSPAKVVSAAESEAHTNIAEAYHELMWLNYTDTGFTGLNELYSLANTEYYEGINWYNQAMLASGNQALLYFSKAATAYTRAQAHAKQILHALVPPATSSEDLGLRPWFGFWGDWATRDIYD